MKEKIKRLNHFLRENDAYVDFYYNYKHPVSLTMSRKSLQKKGKTVLREYIAIKDIINASFIWDDSIMLTNKNVDDVGEFWVDLYTKASKI